MIASLKGILTNAEHESVVVECCGVGYHVLISFSTYARLPNLGEPLIFFIEHIYKPEINQLIGFFSIDEKKIFKLLINVPGVGAKMALSILSVLSSDDLFRAVEQQDVKAITKASGVGSKLANRIILELQSKSVSLIKSANQSNDALSALLKLGYDHSESLKYIQDAYQNLGPEVSTESIIRHALKVVHGSK